MSANFSAIVERFLDQMWRDSPATATTMGVHDYDDQLGDYSRAAWEERKRNLGDMERRVKALPAGMLSPSDQVDHLQLSRHLALTQAVWSERPPWELDPGMYANLPADALFTLLVREFAPLPDRARSMLSRLREVPQVLAQAQQNLTRPARIHTEIAIEMVAGGVSFLETVIPGVANEVPEVGDALRAAAAEASTALRGYEEFLRQEVLPRSDGEVAIGRALFDRMLAEEHALTLNADDLDRIGREMIAETQAELAAVASTIEPGTPWATLVARAKSEHVRHPAEVKPAYIGAMERAQQFVAYHDLVTLPVGAALEIIDTPEYWRPLMPYAAYFPPGAFEPDQKGFFFVTPIDTTAPPLQQQAQLQGHNRYHMEVVALHEAYPGHHLQFVCAHQHPSRLRRVFANNVFVEGWALYCEQMMQEMGFFQGQMGHLMQLRDQLWRACRIVVDVGLHTRGMTVEEGVRFLVEQAHLEEPNAVAEVKRYTTTPTQPMSYMIGKREILHLRDAYAARMGERFTLRGFHDALLSHGSLPPALIRKEMLGAG
jgi:uncharacterized protein (DUF885 family)